MGLSEIAAGLEVTTAQDDPGVATVDRTNQSLTEQLKPIAEELPCDRSAAATVVEEYVSGASIGRAGRAAGIAPVRAAKTLHLLGESVSPIGPTGQDVLRDWLAGEISRTDALELTRLSENEFALATYVETHDPLPAGQAAVEEAVAARETTDDPLADARSETADLL